MPSTSRRRTGAKKKKGAKSSSRRFRNHVVSTKDGRRYRVTTFPGGKTVRKAIKSPEASSAKIERSVKSGKLHPALGWHALKKVWHGKVPAEYNHMKWTKKGGRSSAGRKKKKAAKGSTGRRRRRRA